MVKFNSRKGQNRPFIDLVANGENRRFYAAADTYVSAGENRFKNFGKEKQLLVEESFTSIHADATTDSYTRRAVLKFDFSELTGDEKISSAELHIYGFMKKVIILWIPVLISKVNWYLC